MTARTTADLVTAFTAAFTTDDIDTWRSLLDSEGEWVVVATGETFRGLDQMAQLAARSVAARKHGGGLGIKPTNVFTKRGRDQTLLGVRAYRCGHRQVAVDVLSQASSRYEVRAADHADV
jgi:hypothetical protein